MEFKKPIQNADNTTSLNNLNKNEFSIEDRIIADSMKDSKEEYDENLSLQNMILVEKLRIDKELRDVFIKYKDQIIGREPAIKAIDIYNLRKNILNEFDSIKDKSPAKIISMLFNIEEDFLWIKDAVNEESLKEKGVDEKNVELKKYLNQFIKEVLDKMVDLIDQKPGYLIKTLIDDYIYQMQQISYKNNGVGIIAKEPKDMIDVAMRMPGLLAYVPSVKDVRFLKENFTQNDELFRIKYGHVDKLIEDNWVPIEEIPEYVDINPELITSKNIINLSSFDNFLVKQKNIPINKITFKEKVLLYNYLLTATDLQFFTITAAYENLKNINFLRSFLVVKSYDREMGNRIISLGLGRKDILRGEQIYSKEFSNKIFDKYGSIIDSTKKVTSLLNQYSDKNNSDIITKIEKSRHERGAMLLNDFYEKMESNLESNELLSKLDRYNEEVLLFADVYKSFAESGEKLDLETIASTEIKVLSREEREKNADNLWAITKENRKSFITDENEMKKREERFRETLNNDNVDFYSLEFNKNTVAFCSFEKEMDGSFLVESLNVESEVKGSKVGGDFFKVLIEKVRKQGPIYGYVHEKNAGTLPYYEKLGFKSEKVEKDGLPFYKITLEKLAE